MILHLTFCLFSYIFIAAVPTLPGSPVPWFVGLWKYWSKEAQLLGHLVLLLVSLCRLLLQAEPVPQQDAKPSAQDLRFSPLLL